MFFNPLSIATKIGKTVAVNILPKVISDKLTFILDLLKDSQSLKDKIVGTPPFFTDGKIISFCMKDGILSNNAFFCTSIAIDIISVAVSGGTAAPKLIKTIALLKNKGIATFEFQYLINLIDNLQFDTMYHEHYSYFSLLSIEFALSSIGLEVFHCEEISTHGGSLRVYVKHKNNLDIKISSSKNFYVKKELKKGVRSTGYYKSFEKNVLKIKRNFKLKSTLYF